MPTTPSSHCSATTVTIWGDHHAWQKESFFEASCRIPLLISWPDQLKADVSDNQLAALTDPVRRGYPSSRSTRDARRAGYPWRTPEANRSA